MLTVLSVGLGALLVTAALRDIFHTLWHPTGFGMLARRLFQLVWRASRLPLVRRAGGELTGPLGAVAVVLTWTTLVVAGFALVYVPFMPEHFHFGSSLSPGRESDVGKSLYLSLVTVATLGFGDVLPEHPALRVVVPLQALVGFVLLTAAISWVLQLYPALARRRVLARHLDVLRSTGFEEHLAGDDAATVVVVEQLVTDLLSVEVDLRQYGESYYFRESDPGLSIAAALPYAGDLARACEGSSSATTRAAGRRLRAALDRLADLLAEQFVDAADGDVLGALLRDHRHADGREDRVAG